MAKAVATIWAALIGAVLGLGAAPVMADPVAPTVLVPVLDLYVDTEVGAHNFALGCMPPSSPARDEAGWSAATATFIATLWANGFPTDFVNGARQRLDAAPVPASSCAEATTANFGSAGVEGWPADFARILGGMDLTVVAAPVTPEAWAAIKSAIAVELPQETRLLECLAVTYPELMPVSVHDWDQMIVEIGGKLVAAGLPHDEIATVLGAAEANSLWHRVAPDAAAALKASCDGDQAWKERFDAFTFLTLGGTVDKLLPQPPADADSP